MNVLVIVARGLHAGYLGCYGNDWVDTPTLDALAAEGVVFDQHYADRPDAGGARHAWRTGRYRFPHPEEQVCAPDEPDLPECLRTSGVRITLILDERGTPAGDFTTGWEEVIRVPAAAAGGTPLERTLEAALEALTHPGGNGHRLVWVELATLLPPWDVPAEYVDLYFREEAREDEEDEEETETEPPVPLEPLPDPRTGPSGPGDETFLRLQRTYAAAVTYLDAGLGALLEELKAAGTLRDLLVLVTTDHGQALGEHGIVGPYRPWLHEEVIHLPLLVRLPDALEAGRRVGALTQPVDLLPSLLDCFGVPGPPAHGRSLLPLARGTAEHVRPYACCGWECGGGLEWALRAPDWAFLLPLRQPDGDPPRGPQLYVKPDDRWEVNNVVQHHLELAERLEQTLRDFVAATRRPGPLEAPELPGEEVGAATVPETMPPDPGGPST
jgi:hypothetical protein